MLPGTNLGVTLTQRSPIHHWSHFDYSPPPHCYYWDFPLPPFVVFVDLELSIF